MGEASAMLAMMHHPVATRQQAAMPRCPSSEEEGVRS